ncbi:MAG: hypothetical protein UY07_C0045G0021, partial [Parcubacteria group bacterium GW2011_GWA1_47_8]
MIIPVITPLLKKLSKLPMAHKLKTTYKISNEEYL